jgi:hypothetical protein
VMCFDVKRRKRPQRAREWDGDRGSLGGLSGWEFFESFFFSFYLDD